MLLIRISFHSLWRFTFEMYLGNLCGRHNIVHHGHSKPRQSRKGCMCWRVDSSANHSLGSVWSSTVTNGSKPKPPAFLEIITYFNMHFLSVYSLLLVNNFNTIHVFKHSAFCVKEHVPKYFYLWLGTRGTHLRASYANLHATPRPEASSSPPPAISSPSLHLKPLKTEKVENDNNGN